MVGRLSDVAPPQRGLPERPARSLTSEEDAAVHIQACWRRELALGGHLGWRAQYGVDWRHDPAKGGSYTRWSPSYRESERSTAEYGRSIGVHVDVTSDGDTATATTRFVLSNS